MSAAEREAERRYVMGHGAGYSYPREAVVTMKRGAFVAGAEWQAEFRVTDEMVEAGARALADWDGADWDRPEPEFDAHEAVTKRAYRVGATAVLTAVLGKEKSDEC